MMGIFTYAQCEECGKARDSYKGCFCASQRLARKFAEYNRRMQQEMLEDFTKKSLAREASLTEIRRLSRETVRFGMHSTIEGYHQHGACVRFGRSSCPPKFSTYQGEF